MMQYRKARALLQSIRIAFNDKGYQSGALSRMSPIAGNRKVMAGTLPAESCFCQGNAIGAVVQPVVTIPRSMCGKLSIVFRNV